MSRIDQNVYKAVCSENKSRVDFFLKNADKLYAQAKVVDSKFKKRLATLQREIEQVWTAFWFYNNFSYVLQSRLVNNTTKLPKIKEKCRMQRATLTGQKM